jgi:hypothetical protein
VSQFVCIASDDPIAFMILIIYFANKVLFLLFLFYLADGAMTTVSKMESKL